MVPFEHPEPPQKRLVNVRCTEAEIALLDAVAGRLGNKNGRSGVVRAALSYYLANHPAAAQAAREAAQAPSTIS
jgi:hypothetical protein